MAWRNSYEAVVAGHICLDIIPSMAGCRRDLGQMMVPGRLTEVGPLVTATGGTVSNTGLALHHLGLPTLLMGKVGDDLIGKATRELIESRGHGLAAGMRVAPEATSSYTIIINPPGVDRIFLHCAGANDSFGVADLDFDLISRARLFHFGYPPIMRRMYENGGTELAAMYEEVGKLGLTTSLDLAQPDPDGDSGRVDWPALLRRVLPRVDIFMPSFDELLFCLDRRRWERASSDPLNGDMLAAVGVSVLSELSAAVLDMGVSIVALKLGDHGLYLRTTASVERMSNSGLASPRDAERWCGREMLVPCFAVEVAGTTGAGDSTIAGFLAALLKGLGPEDALTSAVGVGGFDVEEADAVSGVPSWEALQRRIASGWGRRDLHLPLSRHWCKHAEWQIWKGPFDGRHGARAGAGRKR